MDVPVEEAALVLKITESIPHVFKTRGTPDDLDFILSHLKQAVCHRGVSPSTQKLIVSQLIPLGRFKAGYMDIKELQAQMQEAGLMIENAPYYSRKVGSIPELRRLAVQLHWYSQEMAKTPELKSPRSPAPVLRSKSLPAKSLPRSLQKCPPSPSPLPRAQLTTALPAARGGEWRRDECRLVYTRDILLKLKASHTGRHYDLPRAISSSCNCKTSPFPWMKTMKQIACTLEALSPDPNPITPPDSPVRSSPSSLQDPPGWAPIAPKPRPEGLFTATLKMKTLQLELTPPDTPTESIPSRCPTKSFTPPTKSPVSPPILRLKCHPLLKNPPTKSSQLWSPLRNTPLTSALPTSALKPRSPKTPPISPDNSSTASTTTPRYDMESLGIPPTSPLEAPPTSPKSLPVATHPSSSHDAYLPPSVSGGSPGAFSPIYEEDSHACSSSCTSATTPSPVHSDPYENRGRGRGRRPVTSIERPSLQALSV